MEKLELDLEQAFDLRGYQFSLKEGKVRPTLEHLQTSGIQKLLSGSTCPVQRLMPLIALLTAIAKPVHIGGLPYQADTVALDKQLESTWITKRWSQFTPPSAKMVAAGRPCASRSTITPTEYALQILIDALRRVGYSLKGTHCKGNLAPSEASYTLISGIKGGLLALKSSKTSAWTILLL